MGTIANISSLILSPICHFQLLVGGVLDTLSSLIVNAVMGHCGSDDIICVVESEVDDKEEAEEKRLYIILYPQQMIVITAACSM